MLEKDDMEEERAVTGLDPLVQAWQMEEKGHAPSNGTASRSWEWPQLTVSKEGTSVLTTRKWIVQQGPNVTHTLILAQ